MIPNFSMNQLRQAVISFPMLGENFSVCPPASFTLFGREFYLYGVIIAIGFLLAIWYCCKYTCPRVGINSDNLFDALYLAVPLGIICARLYFCFTYHDADGSNPYLADPKSFLYIWEGGLAIYGGVIGGALGVFIASRIKKIPVGTYLDACGSGLLIGQFIGRWGNFTNREAFGWTENVDKVFCRMGLTVPGFDTYYVHPTFLYESLWNFIGFLLLHFWMKKERRRFDGQNFVMYLGWYGLGRMFIEGVRTDSLWLVPGVIRISQLLAAVTLVAAIILLAVLCRKKDRVLYVQRQELCTAEGAAEETEPEAETGAAAETEADTEETTPAAEQAPETDAEDNEEKNDIQ